MRWFPARWRGSDGKNVREDAREPSRKITTAREATIAATPEITVNRGRITMVRPGMHNIMDSYGMSW